MRRSLSLRIDRLLSSRSAHLSLTHNSEALQDYLLGEEWYVVSPLSHEQVNTELVHDILYKFSKKYRKEYKKSLESKGE